MGTRSTAKAKSKAPDISKIVEDTAMEWIRTNFREIADKSLRKENDELKKQIRILKQTNRMAVHKISTIKNECKWAMGELDCAYGDEIL